MEMTDSTALEYLRMDGLARPSHDQYCQKYGCSSGKRVIRNGSTRRGSKLASEAMVYTTCDNGKPA
jgi:hypothetical protein